jgi:hypothetical protein
MNGSVFRPSTKFELSDLVGKVFVVQFDVGQTGLGVEPFAFSFLGGLTTLVGLVSCLGTVNGNCLCPRLRESGPIRLPLDLHQHRRHALAPGHPASSDSLDSFNGTRSGQTHSSALVVFLGWFRVRGRSL